MGGLKAEGHVKEEKDKVWFGKGSAVRVDFEGNDVFTVVPP